MASQVTHQTNTTGGSDSSVTKRNGFMDSKGNTSDDESKSKSEVNGTGEQSSNKVSETTQTSTRSAGLNEVTTREDASFTVAFKVSLKGTLGVNEYPKIIPTC